jgi:hypothetical protein
VPGTLGIGSLGNGQVVRISGNSTAVAKGDKLGVALGNTGTVPLCHLQQYSSGPEGATLFIDGANQVRRRSGRDGVGR